MYRIIETQTGKPITTDSVAFTPAGKILVIKENSYEFADPAKFKLVEYPVPEKAQFCKLLKAMKNLDKKQDKIYSVLQETCEDSALYLPSVKNDIISYLTECFHDKSEWIWYFICDLDYGTAWKPGMVTYDGKDYSLKTYEELYDLLIGNL